MCSQVNIHDCARNNNLPCNVVTLFFLGEQERIRKEVTEQYTVKIEEFELKLSDAETKIKGNFVIFNEHFERKDALFAKQFN